MPTSTDGPARSRARRHPGDAAPPSGTVDAPGVPSVSSAGIDGPATASSHSRPAPSIIVGHEGHELVAVGPGTAGPLLRYGPHGTWPMNPLPVQAAKIHRPLLRHDTLSRERLNSWLEKAARSRLALVIAEAGFGKTTFLADWSSRTKRRTSWYRLETDDRDWLTLIRHLVAGGREVDESFASETYRLLSSLGPGGPTQADLITSLAKEMAAFGAADPRGFSLILDDYHAIEGSDETDPIVRALLEATGPGFSIVMSARTAPALPVERLRGRKAVQRLDGDQLRFDVPETDQLFRDAYHIPLEPDVVTELVARTEGWAALLSLVRTNLDERPDPDPRALVAQLSATRGDLYDFLAEEVLVDLPSPLHDFLIRVSILAEVDARVASLVDGRDLPEIQSSIAEAEALGLLLRPDRASSHRFHPLVRDFLVAKLEEAVGPVEMRAIHRRIAEALEPTNWLASALHYRSAKAPEDAARVVDEAIPAIIGAGEFEAALPLLDGTAGPADRVGALVLRSRIEFVRGNWRHAITLAEAAAGHPEDPLAATAMLNLSSLEGVAGFPDHAIERAASALHGRLANSERRVAEASLLLKGARVDANLAEVADALRQLAMEQEFSGLSRYAAISRLNLACVLIWLGNPRAAIREAVRAETALGETTASVERVAAMTARATALVQLRQTSEAAVVLRHALAASSPLSRHEAELEVARLEANYGSISKAHEALDRLDVESLPSAYLGLWYLDLGLVALRDGEGQKATTLALMSRDEVLRDVAGALRTQMLIARTMLARRDPEAAHEIAELARIAARQGSRPGVCAAAVLRALAGGGPVGKEITSLGPDDRHVLSLLAEDVCRHLPVLSATALGVVLDEARARPDRWRSALRLVASSAGPARLPAAQLLSEIGDDIDASFLRDLARDKQVAPSLRCADHAASCTPGMPP